MEKVDEGIRIEGTFAAREAPNCVRYEKAEASLDEEEKKKILDEYIIGELKIELDE